MSTVTFYPELEQGSDEWLAARCGILTASVIGKLLSVSRWTGIDYSCRDCGAAAGAPCVSVAKGKESAPIKAIHGARTRDADDFKDSSPLIVKAATGDDADSLTLSLVAERITQHVEQGYVSDAMYRGQVEEPLARAAYAEHYKRQVDEMGFITRDIGNGWKLGYSPDGMVGEDGLFETKSRGQKAQVATVLAGEVPIANLPQLQAGLFVTGRKWIDYTSYSNGMPLWIERVYPNPMWFDAITTAVTRFENVAAEMVAKYETAVIGLPVMERTVEIEELRV